MRSNPADFPLSAPPTLDALLHTLAQSPNAHTLLAGGTELMVALNTGRLPPKPLLSIAHLPELRFIDVAADRITLGAATTFTDIRRSEAIAQHVPLLAQAASWTGSVANQNRGTLGGNLVNASPAADTPPVLLVYDAEVPSSPPPAPAPSLTISSISITKKPPSPPTRSSTPSPSHATGAVTKPTFAKSAPATPGHQQNRPRRHRPEICKPT